MAQRVWTFFQLRSREASRYYDIPNRRPLLASSRSTVVTPHEFESCFAANVLLVQHRRRSPRFRASARTGFARTRDRRKPLCARPACFRLWQNPKNGLGWLVHLLHGLAARPIQRRLALKHRDLGLLASESRQTSLDLVFRLDL